MSQLGSGSGSIKPSSIFELAGLGRMNPNCRRVTADGVVQHANRLAHVGVQFGLGDTGLLEVDGVDEVVAEILLARQGADGRPNSGRHAQREHRVDPLRIQRGHVPADDGAPVVSDQRERLMSQCVGDADRICRQRDRVVRLRICRFVAAAVASLIGNGNLIAGGDQVVDLVAPQVSALRKAVQQKQ